MSLSKSDFKHTHGACLCDGKATEIHYYTYESKKILYDVLFVKGTKLYNVNRKATPNNCAYPIHKTIEKHFSI